MPRNSVIHTIHESYNSNKGDNIKNDSYYQILDGVHVNFKRYGVKEMRKTHTGVEWLTIQNWIDEFDVLKDATKKYPKAAVFHNYDNIRI